MRGKMIKLKLMNKNKQHTGLIMNSIEIAGKNICPTVIQTQNIDT